MGYRLAAHPFAKALERSAQVFAPDETVYEEIFCTVMQVAGIAPPVSSQLLNSAFSTH